MSDRTLFLADEINCLMLDDFCVLQTTPYIKGRVLKPLDAAYWRHVAFFSYTH